LKNLYWKAYFWHITVDFFSMPPLTCTTVTTQTTAAPNSGNLTGHDTTDIDIADPCDKVEDEYSKETEKVDSSDTATKEEVPLQIVWRNVVLFAYLHLAAFYAVYPIFTSAKWQTNLLTFILYLMSGLGVTAGVHRLWAHRSYKARLPLRIFLAFIYTIAFENDIYEWCRDHRVHHKYSETNADPHNAKRGFFFAHIGWLLCRKHPEVAKKGKAVDLSDLLADPVVRFHRKYYVRLVLVCCFILPTITPMYLWNETFWNSLLIPTLFRLCFTLNQTWLVNSAAHMWGSKPYDVNINPRENAWVVLGAVGEGFHNYHHTFPYDYATSEYGIKYNLTTAFIDLMALFGLAYDCKTASKKVIQARKLRTGEDSLKQASKATSDSPKQD